MWTSTGRRREGRAGGRAGGEQSIARVLAPCSLNHTHLFACNAGDLDHIWIVGSYFHYSVPGGFTKPQAKDISPARRGGILGGSGGDPMYVVFARKQPAAGAA